MEVVAAAGGMKWSGVDKEKGNHCGGDGGCGGGYEASECISG